jgi:hypothetical protein
LKPLIHIRDPEKAAGSYDKCINDSPNGLIYALSWYLNIVCPDWEILATEDYSTVMPLPVTHAWGRKILRQPEYAWQLGVFSTSIPSPGVVSQFLRSIPDDYRLKRLCLNKLNVLHSGVARVQNSAELDLIRPYTSIRSRYGATMKESLLISQESRLSYVGNISVHDYLMFAYRLDKLQKRRLKPRDISLLRLITTNAIRYRNGQIGAAYDAHNNLVATVTFLVFRGRASIIHATASSEGLASGSIEYIIDRYIKGNAGKNLVLCIDNPDERKIMDILKNCGSALSTSPCIRNRG